MAPNPFIKILQVALYLTAVWFGGKAMKLIKSSPIPAEIAVGMVLGPHVFDLVPFPEAFQLFGKIGVTLMICEVGLQFDLRNVRKIGGRSALIALTASFVPFGLGIAVSLILGFELWPIALSVGTTLMPMSIATSAKLLREVNLIQSPLGQTIISSGFGAVICALVTYSILTKVAKGAVSAWAIASPIVFSIIFFVVAGLLAGKIIPLFLPKILQRIPPAKRDGALLAMIICTCILFGYAGSVLSSDLLGAFLAGMSYASHSGAVVIWRKQLKRILYWLTRIFFSATIGFAIPVQKLFALGALWRGVILGIFASLSGKLTSGLVAARGDRLTVAWGMVPRGEFAYLVAQTAAATNVASTGDTMLPSDLAFPMILWALLMATISASFAMRYLFGRYAAKMQAATEKANADAAMNDELDAVEGASTGVAGLPEQVGKAVPVPATIPGPPEGGFNSDFEDGEDYEGKILDRMQAPMV